ncbi:hypothetical protein [Novipirellula caenicola]|uniref:hypothetical protein n=1 Tax=Novipirellula caenicola TaxID=1536901 RepID=UPI0031EBF6B7
MFRFLSVMVASVALTAVVASAATGAKMAGNEQPLACCSCSQCEAGCDCCDGSECSCEACSCEACQCNAVADAGTDACCLDGSKGIDQAGSGDTVAATNSSVVATGDGCDCGDCEAGCGCCELEECGCSDCECELCVS